MPGVYTNGMQGLSVGVPVAGSYNAISGYETLPVDTGRPTGANPSSVAASAFQLAALSAAINVNTQTSTANAATSSTFMGRIVTEAVTTAAGANYTMTLTNTICTATSNVQAAVYSGTNTVPGPIIFSITPAAGSCVILVRNNGTAALNGTLVIVWMVAPD